MSRIRADRYTNREGTGAPTFSQGVNVVGSGVSIGIGASVYSPANNQLVLGTNNVERLRIRSNGDVGINTTGGTYTVQMHEPSAGSFTLQLTTGAIGAASTSGTRITASSSRKLFIENQENEDTLFYNNGGEKLVIKTGGNLSITNGDLVVASGHGIDFSATSDGSGTATSELLDDYEEGSFLPTAFGGTASGTTTYGLQYGHYIKVGSLVHIQIRMTVSTATGTGQLTIGNLPYISLTSSTSGYAAMNIPYASQLNFGGSNTNYLGAYTVQNSNYMLVFATTTGASVTSTPMDSSFTVIVGGTYATNS